MERHDHNAYRTEVATLSANGAWYVQDEESNTTDCAASATGPSLPDEQANQFRANENGRWNHLLASGN